MRNTGVQTPAYLIEHQGALEVEVDVNVVVNVNVNADMYQSSRRHPTVPCVLSPRRRRAGWEEAVRY